MRYLLARITTNEGLGSEEWCSPAADAADVTVSKNIVHWLAKVRLCAACFDAPGFFRPVLAAVCDLLRTPQLLADAIAPSAFALVVSLNGLAHHLPGRSTGPHLGEGGALRRLLLDKLAIRCWMPQRFVWADKAGCCHRVAITPCRSNAILVTEELAPWPYDLTIREIQVLHLVACGASNPQIAE